MDPMDKLINRWFEELAKRLDSSYPEEAVDAAIGELADAIQEATDLMIQKLDEGGYDAGPAARFHSRHHVVPRWDDIGGDIEHE